MKWLSRINCYGWLVISMAALAYIGAFTQTPWLLLSAGCLTIALVAYDELVLHVGPWKP